MAAADRRFATPWQATLCACVAAASVLLALCAFRGPWLVLALVATAAAIIASVITARQARGRAEEAIAASARAALAEAERDSLRRDLQRQDELKKQLMFAKQAAEAAAMAKGEFLATMSHEIRTPLNGIIPMLDLIARSQLAVDQRELLQTATSSSMQLLRIVDDILDYSKLEANKLELEITTFNLRDLAEGVVQLMQQSADEKRLRVNLQIDPAVRLSVRGDPVRLRQVIGNLIGNAVKFTERGSIDVDIRRLGETRAQHLLRIEVRDTGIGIDPEQQARLFNSFTQADASTTRLYGGTGLGLAICKRIIDLMGGRIGVQSEPQRGSTFWFEIPLLKVVGDMNQAGADYRDVRVLLVTSEPRLAHRLRPLLSGWGIQLVHVDTTQEALERLRAAAADPLNTPRFQVVLADHDALRYSARALHRALTRPGELNGTRLIWLYGEEALPEELQDHHDMLPRQVLDADLRATLLPPAPAPAAPEPSQPAAVEAVPPASTTEQSITSHEYRILLVEDNPVNLLVAQKMLAVFGHRADTAADGEAALSRMAQTNYDLVLMDCQMPVLDGYTATRRWRASEAAQGSDHLPIVAMTANAMAGDRQRCLDAGMDDYLSKPVSREQLDACLGRWLKLRRPSAPAPELGPAPPAEAQPLPATESTALPILDTSVLDELREVAGGETARIIRLFLEDAPELIGKLEAAAGSHSMVLLREASHVLKSSSANVGAIALSNAARRIELATRAGTIERPAVMVALVIAEYARVRLALSGYLARLETQLQEAEGAQSSSLVSR